MKNGSDPLTSGLWAECGAPAPLRCCSLCTRMRLLQDMDPWMLPFESSHRRYRSRADSIKIAVATGAGGIITVGRSGDACGPSCDRFGVM